MNEIRKCGCDWVYCNGECALCPLVCTTTRTTTARTFIKDTIINDASRVNRNLVEVVRCNDCVYWDNSNKYPYCWFNDDNTEADDYCSKGKKKNDE